MRKLIVAIVLFSGAAIGGVWFLTRDGEGPAPRDAAPAAEPIAPAPPPLVLPPPPDPARPFARADAPETVTVVGAAPVEAPRGTWEAVSIIARASALGPAAGPVGRGLNELQPRVAACFDEVTEARFGTTSHTSVRDTDTLDAQGAAVLLLQIEIVGGQASIVDAPVETQGAASDGLVACAQQVLRGQRFSAPQASDGRYRLLYPLSR